MRWFLVSVTMFAAGCLFGREPPPEPAGEDAGVRDVATDSALPSSDDDVRVDAVAPDVPEPVDADPGECGNGELDPGEKCDPAIPPGEKGSCPIDPESQCPFDGCSTPYVVGTPEDCTAECRTRDPIIECIDGDDCCPVGCDAADDDACAAVCGNDIVEPGETCDGDCPESCDDLDPCTVDGINGTAEDCDVRCIHLEITTCTAGDSCCPAACVLGDDTDCRPFCGNGKVDDGEKCDGHCPVFCEDDGDACTVENLVGDPLMCSAECTSTTIEQCLNGDGCCPSVCNARNDDDCSAVCGNGVVEGTEICDGNCPTDCPNADGDACTVEGVVGDPANCDAECQVIEDVVDCVDGDGCCPAACTEVDDSDCAGTCGNGVVEGGETCDGNCPTSCGDADGDACTVETLVGSDCTRECVIDHTIDTCTDGDGCCPTGCDSTNDTDCASDCGNGVVEAGELCDGNCPTLADCEDGDLCTTHTLSGSAATCDARCVDETITMCVDDDSCCPGDGLQTCNETNDNNCMPVCGNNVIETGESCDGNCPTTDADCDDNDSCTTDYVSGTMCDAVCNNDTITACIGGDACCPGGCDATNDSDCSATCGNGVVEGAEKCDGDCPTSDADCDDTIACTNDYVSGTNCQRECANDLDPSYCLISGSCYAATAKNPADQCEVCDPSTSQSSWTIDVGGSCDDGEWCTDSDACDSTGNCTGTQKACGDGKTCTSDTCDETNDVCVNDVNAGECLIDGACYVSGDPNPNNSCEECEPATSKTSWTVQLGKSCNDGEWCTESDACDSSGTCTGTPKTCGDGNSCTSDSCDETNQTCLNTINSGTCLINDKCYSTGDENPNNSCEECDPATSQTSWTVQSGKSCNDNVWCTHTDTCDSTGSCSGTDKTCGDGNTCTTDTCDEGNQTCVNTINSGKCLINDECYSTGDTNPNNYCEECEPATSKTSWTAQDGKTCSDNDWCTTPDTCDATGTCGGPARCNDGLTCTTDSCNALSQTCTNSLQAGYCLINNRCWQNGERNPTNPCRYCDPNNSPDTWTYEAYKTPCDDGKYCTVSWCDLNGFCVDTGMATCDDGKACTTDTCDEQNDKCSYTTQSDMCLIDGVCRDSGECDPNFGGCMCCDPNKSQTSATPAPQGYACGDSRDDCCDGMGNCIQGGCP